MPANPNKLSQFWQELKRRRVIHVITVYASAAFVIIELINNLAEPLNLPPNLLIIVVIVLAVGFPLAIILSWLYDVTSEGVEKTKPIEEVKEGEKTVIPNAWKIATYVSFIVIVGLAVLNIVGGGKQLRAGDIQSLLILPFDNLTGDDQLDWVAAGMHTSLIGDMGRVSRLRVLGKTTSNLYSNLELSLPQIATELNVDAVVEPSVMCYGDSVCVLIRVITPFPEEKQLWMAEYKVEKSQIMNLYNRVTKKISDELMVQLTPEEERMLAETKTVNPEAHDAYLRGLFYWEQFTPEAIEQALEYFNKAIEIDPDWAPPYAGIAYYWIALRQFGYAPPSIAVPRIHGNLEKAFKLDTNSDYVYYVSALASVWTDFNWEKGEREFLKVLEINPNDALARVYYAHLMMILRRDSEAHVQVQIALDLDPMNPMVQALSSMVMAYTGEYNQAIELGEKALSLAPGNGVAISALYIAHLYKEEYHKSFDLWISLFPIDEEVRLTILNTCDEEGYIAAAIKFAEEYKNTGHVLPFEMVQLYAIANDIPQALDWMEKGYEDHDANTPYFGTNWFSDGPFKIDDPRHIELMKKLNLPLPEEYLTQVE
jgi:TolB-like protein